MPDEFWGLTLSEFIRMHRGWLRRQQQAQQQQLSEWRRTRLLATILRNAHRGPNELALQPEEFLALPGDPPPAPPMSEQEFDDTMARLAEFDKLQPAA